MPPDTTVPVTVAPDAAARVAELGLQHEFGQMVEYALRHLPGLRALRATLEPDYEGGDPLIYVDATTDRPYEFNDPAERAWREWQADNFPWEVRKHFPLLTNFLPADAR